MKREKKNYITVRTKYKIKRKGKERKDKEEKKLKPYASILMNIVGLRAPNNWN